MPRRLDAALTAVLVVVSLLLPRAGAREVYTTNAVCLKKHCVNPIFPGLEDLARLDEASWTCSTQRKVMKAMKFCRGALNYDPALPVVQEATDFDSLVRKQDSAAMTMYFYHLSGMGLEAWDYPKPEVADDCIKSVWRMVCYTYFPRVPLGCEDGQPTNYMRPCQSSCQNYIRQCAVECCDESVQCVFSHKKSLSTSFAITQTGYVPHDGPSSLCTGSARRLSGPGQITWLLLAAQALALCIPSASSRGADEGQRSPRRPSSTTCASWRPLAYASTLVVLAMSLQGCNFDVPTHNVGNWRAEPDYLIEYEFVPPGGPARAAMLNSCSLQMLSPTLQCGGRGICRAWDEDNVENPMAFCDCDRDWADPECGTRRKSQVVAYLFSVFLGFAGADMFYLGFPIAGVLKLSTLGGFGVWWVADMIRIGCAPVPSRHFTVAADFPHWAFVLCQVSMALVLGFAVAYVTLLTHVSQRRKDALMMQSDEEHRHLASQAAALDKIARVRGGQPQPTFAFPVNQLPDYGTMGDRPSWVREAL